MPATAGWRVVIYWSGTYSNSTSESRLAFLHVGGRKGAAVCAKYDNRVSFATMIALPYPSAVTVARAVRLAEFLRRLSEAPPANSAGEAFQLVARTLTSVEDELTDIPENPDAWQTDGRLYPPQPDSRREVPDHREVVR